MVRTVLLLAAAVLLLGSCAEESLSDQRRRDLTSQAATCAMCGASVSGGYFEQSLDKTLGPGQGW
jgi:hypothetical protein